MKIDNITGTIPYTDKAISIELKGKNLIFTGKNGCGKTQLLQSLSHALDKAKHYALNKSKFENNIKRALKSIATYEKELLKLKQKKDEHTSHLNELEAQKSDEQNLKQVEYLKTLISQNKSQIDTYTNAFKDTTKQISQYEQQELESRSHVINQTEQQTIIEYIESEIAAPLYLYFKAQRHADVKAVQSVTSMASEKEKIRQQSKMGNRPNRSTSGTGTFIESYLANWEVKAALKFKNGDCAVRDELEKWKENLIQSLRVLLDDDSTTLSFDEDSFTYHIKQDHKHPFTFRDLSSGYASILQVFTDILMEIEISEFRPDTTSGFIIIDEIDAHLHTSLQKKVLPFFTQLFPNIQFIVSTHSPFVITSDENIVIYDLSSLKQISSDEVDLRLYGAEILMESFLNVSAQSDWLDAKLQALTKEQDIKKLAALITELSPSESILDSEALTYFYQAKRKLQQHKEENNLV